jgi:predicted PurR-regulated permease PerM
VISQDEQGPGTAPTLPKRSRGVRSRRRLTATATPSPTPDLSGVETNATLRPIRQYLTSALTICLFIIAGLATIFALYAAKEVALPLALAIVLKLLFQPAVQVVSGRLRLPNVVGALAVIVCLVLAIGALALGVSGPASTWIQKLPQVIPTVKEKFAVLGEPVEYLQKGFREIEDVASPSGSPDAPQVTVKQPSSIGSYLAAGIVTAFGRLVTMLVMLFFLLASGDRLLRAFIEILPRFSDKRQTVEIATEIQHQIGAYLLTITVMNSLVGAATALAMVISGLGDPILWGVGAFLLNFVPILGPLVGICILLLAGIVSLDWPWHALLPAGLYLLIHMAEGEAITPMLLAKRFTLNPVLVILSLFFWYALWGVPGAILAVPLLGMGKIVCDRIAPLQSVGHLLGA